MAANGSATAAAIYAHPLRAIRYMLATRGVADLYSGMPAAYAHNILLNGIRIGMFDAAREGLSSLAPGALGGPTGLACSLLAGFGTGIAGALVASPFTLVKNRQQAWIPTQTHAVSSRYPVYLPASSGTPHYSFSAQFYHTAPASHVLHLAPQAAASTAPPRSVLVNLSQILARQGAAGLYTGARISALRMGLGSAMQLAFYDAAKRSIASTSEAPGVATTFVAAVASGVTTSFIMTPLDLVLTRVQSAGRSTLSVLRHTLAKEGLTGFWKGGAATLLRSTTQTVITFLVYENLRDALGGISGARDSEGDGGRWRGFAFEE
ncbi:mitochondrial carrier domain-containing protein [Hyaloraphidium curvatum]|nr:mitochondrial carrier domain-containing protein [Hyaloraphidium curvatum]